LLYNGTSQSAFHGAFCEREAREKKTFDSVFRVKLASSKRGRLYTPVYAQPECRWCAFTKKRKRGKKKKKERKKEGERKENKKKEEKRRRRKRLDRARARAREERRGVEWWAIY